MNPRLRRIQKLEGGKKVKGRIIVVTAPADCPDGRIDKAIANAGLPPAEDQDFVIVLTRFAAGDFEPTAHLHDQMIRLFETAGAGSGTGAPADSDVR